MTNGILDWARFYVSRGLSVIPIAPRAKTPHFELLKQVGAVNERGEPSTAPYFARQPTEEELRTWFEGRGPEEVGVGIVAGVRGIILIDDDGGFSRLVVGEELMGDTWVSRPSKGAHFIFRIPDGMRIENFELPGKIELKSRNKYVVAPPSIHPSGHRYTWFTDLTKTEIRRLSPEEVREILKRLGWLRRRLPLIEKLVEAWRPEHRHSLSLGLTGLLRKLGVSREETEFIIRAVCILAGDSEIRDRLRVIEDTWKKAKEEIAGITKLKAELEAAVGPALVEEVVRCIGSRERGEEGESEEKDRFSRAMEIVAQRAFGTFMEEASSEAYITIKEGGYANLQIRGRGFDAWINAAFYEEEGRGLREDIRRDVRATLEAQAFKSGKRRELQLLAAVDEEKERILVDLGDPSWSAFAEIIPGAWRVINPPEPVPFKRTELSAPLPVVEEMIGPEECKKLLSTFLPPTLEEEVRENFSVFFPPWICTALLTHISRPGLLFVGPHGSAKSTAERLIVKLYTGGDVGGLGKNERDVATKLENSPIVGFDNIRNLSPEIADLLAMAVTGGTYTSRRLYTDAEAKVLKFKRVILLNGISPNVFKFPDLMDRFVMVPLRRLQPGERKEEKTLAEEFEVLRPRILAAIFSSLARAFYHLEEVRRDLEKRPEMKPRMTDFAVWGEAIARGMGYKPFEWSKTYLGLIEETEGVILEENPLARTILKLAEILKEGVGELRKIEVLPAQGKGWWVGTPGQLLRKLEEVAGGELQEFREEGFPVSARSLGKRLRELLPPLQDQGIYITFSRNPTQKREKLVWIRVRGGEKNGRTVGRFGRFGRFVLSVSPPPTSLFPFSFFFPP